MAQVVMRCLNCGAVPENDGNGEFVVPYAANVTRSEYEYGKVVVRVREGRALEAYDWEAEDSEYGDQLDWEIDHYGCESCGNESYDLDSVFEMKLWPEDGDWVRVVNESDPSHYHQMGEVIEIDGSDFYVEFDDNCEWFSISEIELMPDYDPESGNNSPSSDPISPAIGDTVLITGIQDGYDAVGHKVIVHDVDSQDHVLVERDDFDRNDGEPEYEMWWFAPQNYSLYKRASGEIIYPFKIGDVVYNSIREQTRTVKSLTLGHNTCTRCEGNTGEDRMVVLDNGAKWFVCHLELSTSNQDRGEVGFAEIIESSLDIDPLQSLLDELG